MENLINKENNDIYNTTYRLNGMYTVAEYLVLNLDKGNFLTDGDTIYNLGKYSSVEKVLVMNNEMYVVVNYNYSKSLIRLNDLDVVFEKKSTYGIFKETEDIVSIFNDYSPKQLFNIDKREYLPGYKDYDYAFKLSDELFVFENKDYEHRHFVITDEKGDVIYDCDSRFPYFINGNLVLIDRKDERIDIVHDLLGKRDKNSVIEHEGVVIAKPQYYNGKFVVVMYGGVVILNDELEPIKTIELKVDGEITDTDIEKDILFLRVLKNDLYKTIVVGLKNGFKIIADSIELLPFWVKTRRTLLIRDKISENRYVITLYNEEGKELVKVNAKDADVIESVKSNIFIFFDATKDNKNLIYNVDTKELRPIPWGNVKFGLDGKEYSKYARGYNNETECIDIMDEDLNPLFSGIDFEGMNIRTSFDEFSFFVLNEFLCITIHVAYGPRSYFRYLLMDKENNIYYNKIGIRISKVGKYLQIQDEDGVSYINSITKERVNGSSLIEEHPMLPDNVTIQDGVVKLIKK